MKNKWCDHAWSPWMGSPRVLADHWQRQEPVRWNKRAERDYVAAAHSTKAGQPIQFDRPRVFPSLCDWLDGEVPVEWLARFIGLIKDTPNLDWQLMTKRPELWDQRIRAAIQYNEECRMGGRNEWLSRWLSGTPPNNVWIGVSVEDQQRADKRIPEILRIPSKLRFLSVEPMLGPVNIMRWVSRTKCPECGGDTVPRSGVGFYHERRCPEHGAFDPDERECIDWVIVGGESGPGARPCNVAWVRDIVRQCAAAGVPCFVKQLGANVVDRNDRGFDGDSGPSGWPMDTLTSDTSMPGQYQGKPVRIRLRHTKGGDPAEWPEDLRVRQMPEVKR